MVQQRQPAALEQVHRRESDRAEHEIANEVAGPVALSVEDAEWRGRAVDHDRAEGQQA